jgi:hypothetical protein
MEAKRREKKSPAVGCGSDPFNPLASVIVFQYNPDTLGRTEHNGRRRLR